MVLSAADSMLLVVDVQARLAPAIDDGEAYIRRCRLLIEAARRLAVPILVTEQYPAGLGPTVPELAELLHSNEIHPKVHFAATAEPGLGRLLGASERRTIVTCGMEAHVCVLQTVFGLQGGGASPVVVADAVGSRNPADRSLALERMRAAGIEIVSSEMVVFEWLGRAGTPAFKALAPLIR
jgi:nicotinamidase-related amidase